ncbi:MAG: sigma-70 family RNA polymerase sigma factor [Proteobacteria bacterium]|nr:sigma-70 family RNA polymerase sigma factor [Pseudomonadota bacterium]
MSYPEPKWTWEKEESGEIEDGPAAVELGSSDKEGLSLYLGQLKHHPRISPARELVLGKRIRRGRAKALDLVLEARVRHPEWKSVRAQAEAWRDADQVGGPSVGEVLTVLRERVQGLAGTRPRNRALADLCRRLTRIEEKVWEALDEMVTANLRFVVKLAKGYANRGLSMEDLIQEGNLGLIKAAGKFDYTTGYRFSTYSVWWIRQFMRRAVQSRGAAEPVLPGDEPPLDLEGGTVEGFSDFLLGQPPDSPLETVGYRDLCEAVRGVLASLPSREERVLRQRYGIETDERQTLEQVGRNLNISRERVRQLELQALARLRDPEHQLFLADLI